MSYLLGDSVFLILRYPKAEVTRYKTTKICVALETMEDGEFPAKTTVRRFCSQNFETGTWRNSCHTFSSTAHLILAASQIAYRNSLDP
jgi:hypothetical protein